MYSTLKKQQNSTEAKQTENDKRMNVRNKFERKQKSLYSHETDVIEHRNDYLIEEYISSCALSILFDDFIDHFFLIFQHVTWNAYLHLFEYTLNCIYNAMSSK